MARASTQTASDSLEVLVIGLSPPDLRPVRRLLPQARHFPAVDLRGSNPKHLVQSEAISISAFDTMGRGRKWHKEFTSAGAVGLQQSVRAALATTDPSRPLLLLEEDCVLHPDVVPALDRLLQCEVDYDVAIFGAINFGSTTESPQLQGWHSLDAGSSFIMTHCVLYSPRGKRRLAPHFAKPQEVQIDALFGMLHAIGSIDLLLNLNTHLAYQSAHASSIQETLGTCILCDIDPRGWPRGHSATALQLLAIFAILAILAKWRAKTA